MNKGFIIALLMSGVVYASEEKSADLYDCYDRCLTRFRYYMNSEPKMTNGRLIYLSEYTNQCCARCEFEEKFRQSSKVVYR